MDSLVKTAEQNLEITPQQWLLLNAIRQTFGISRKTAVTYAEAVALAIDLAPRIIDDSNPLVKAFDAEAIRLYRERADARSRIRNKIVKPLEILDRDIRQLEREATQAKDGQDQAIRSQIRKLQRTRRGLDEISWTETQAIHRDADAYERELPISHKGQGYKEYSVSVNRRLRIRILHPDPPESNSGVDLIYENYYDKKQGKRSVSLVRVAALQYKMWDGKNIYASQTTNLLPQMERMQKTFCETGFCDKPSQNADDRYRLPTCCVFLRPTDKKQTKDAWQVTHAWHVPICVALARFETTDSGNSVLRSSLISNSSVTQGPFQELYNRGMLGSRWISSAKLKALHRRIGILDYSDGIVIHAQEY